MALPSGYTQLEYIEATGTQYIDTGVEGKSTIKAVADFEYTALSGEDVLLGEFSSAGKRCIPIYANSPNWRYGYAATPVSGGSVQTNTRYLVESSMLAGSQTFIVDGVLVLSGTLTTTFNSGFNMFLFSLNVNGSVGSYYASAKLYSCQIYDNGTLVRDFVPCKNASGEIGLYDAANQKFYTNAGTGVFTAGPISGPTGSRTLLDAVNYEIKTGNVLIDGVTYMVTQGKVMENGIVYTIKLTEKEPEEMYYSINITGSGYSTYCYVTIDGSTYTSPATLLVPEGTIISCHVYSGEDTGNTAIFLNGTSVGSGGYAKNYDHTVQSNVTVTLSIIGDVHTIRIET